MIVLKCLEQYLSLPWFVKLSLLPRISFIQRTNNRSYKKLEDRKYCTLRIRLRVTFQNFNQTKSSIWCSFSSFTNTGFFTARSAVRYSKISDWLVAVSQLLCSKTLNRLLINLLCSVHRKVELCWTVGGYSFKSINPSWKQSIFF